MTAHLKPVSLPAPHTTLPVTIVHFPPHGPVAITLLHTPFDWVTVVLVAATIVLAFFTALLWHTTGTLVRGTVKSSEHQLRAYVGVDGISLIDLHLRTETYQLPDTKPGSRLPHKIDVQMRNFGDTPANRVDFIATIWKENAPLPNDDEVDRLLATEKERCNSIPGAFIPRHSIFPAQTAPMQIYLSDLIPFRQVLADQLRNVFVIGRIDYSDIFDNQHTTRFCYFFDKTRDPGKEFAAFCRYNEAS